MWNEPSKDRLACIPKLYETEQTAAVDKIIYLHFFIGSCDWYVAEFDGDDLFYGYAILNGDMDNAEWGYISFSELKDISIQGIEVDCELHKYWQPKQVSQIAKLNTIGDGMIKPECKLIGKDGNVFNLIAIVRKTLKDHQMLQELESFDCDLRLIQQSGARYDDVLALFMDYVDVV